QAEDIRIHADHILKIRAKLNGIIAENTGRSIEEVSKDTDRDNYMTAEEAAAYGLIDKVITSR
ncbi:MAG: ATP-dependent Clp protease proteolytic subunit, partial [Firmicutes bacterium]|nr:ATP-dependent Clp protease proteolytic subunit [Bacillota bacterium]